MPSNSRPGNSARVRARCSMERMSLDGTPPRCMPVSRSICTLMEAPALIAAFESPRAASSLSQFTLMRTPCAARAADALPFALAKNRVGDTDVLNSHGGERFGFADFGAADAARARGHLHLRDLGTLCVLMCGRNFTPR